MRERLEEGARAKECGHPLEARKGKNVDTLCRVQKGRGPATHFRL